MRALCVESTGRQGAWYLPPELRSLPFSFQPYLTAIVWESAALRAHLHMQCAILALLRGRCRFVSLLSASAVLHVSLHKLHARLRAVLPGRIVMARLRACEQCVRRRLLIGGGKLFVLTPEFTSTAAYCGPGSPVTEAGY